MSTGFSSAAIPNAPTIGTATATSDAAATVEYTAAVLGATGTTFTATSNPSSITGTGSSPITVTGLNASTSYTFTVTAGNANGTSAASSASNSITTTAGSSYESISTVTVGAGGTSTITFSSIPSTFKHLQIRGVARSNSGADNTVMRFNGDSGNNYSTHYLVANGGTSTTGNETSASRFYVDILTANSTGNFWSADIIDILDYTSTTKNKTARIIAGQNLNNSNSGTTWLASGLYFATPAAITTVTLTTNSGAGFAQHTSFALYGIKG
jgi:hypothetical protein